MVWSVIKVASLEVVTTGGRAMAIGVKLDSAVDSFTPYAWDEQVTVKDVRDGGGGSAVHHCVRRLESTVTNNDRRLSNVRSGGWSPEEDHTGLIDNRIRRAADDLEGSQTVIF
jgi:hypothetical protein